MQNYRTTSTMEENRGTEFKTDRIELSTRTSETQSVVVKTTVISSCETTVINSSDSKYGQLVIYESYSCS